MIHTTTLFSQIAKARLGVETLDERLSDSLDFHDTHVTAIQHALSDAYQAGMAAGMAAELGITEVVCSASCEQFPWQLFLQSGTCVLVNAAADDHAVIRSRFSPVDDEPLRQPTHAIPLDVLAQVRQACRGVRL